MSDREEAERGEIRADVVAMYKAGTSDIPEQAARMARAADAMAAAIGAANAQLQSMSFPGVGSDLITLMRECHEGVAGSVATLNDLGAGVIAVANDFVERENVASEVFSELGLTLKPEYEPQRMPAPLSESIDSGAPTWTGPYRENPYVMPEPTRPSPLRHGVTEVG